MVEKTRSLFGKSMNMEMDEGDMNELNDEHSEELTTEELKEFLPEIDEVISSNVGNVGEAFKLYSKEIPRKSYLMTLAQLISETL